jgi:hypothetical protein
MKTDFQRILPLLVEGRIDFVLVGGVAAIVHGAARATYDVDIVYARTDANIGRIVSVLLPVRPYLRGAPPGLPFRWDAETLERGLNFTLTTSIGDLDLLGEIVGGGTYEELLPYTEDARMFCVVLRVVTLEKLIQLKCAAGRPKDLEAIAELQALIEEKQRGFPDRPE